MMTSTRALFTYPGLSFPSRTGPCQRLAPRTQPAPAIARDPTRGRCRQRRARPAFFCRQDRSPRRRARLPSDDGPSHRSSTSPPTIHTVLKERRHNQPSQPHPHMPLTDATALIAYQAALGAAATAAFSATDAGMRVLLAGFGGILIGLAVGL